MVAPARFPPGRPTYDEIRRAPKALLHDHLDGGLRPATIVELADAIGPPAARDRRRRTLADWFTHGGRLRLAGALPGDVRAHGRRSCRRPTRCYRVARECALDLAADGVVYAEVAVRARAAPGARPAACPRWSRRCWPASRPARPQARAAGHADPGRHPAHRDAPRRPLDRDRRAGGALPRRRRGRLRHRRRRGRLPAHPAPGRLRVPAAGELPLHHPRRRGVRAAVDLAGDPVVRRRPARARRAHRRRHRARAGRPDAGAAGRVRAGQADPAGAVPVVERADRRGRRRSPSTRSACCATCGSGSPSTPTTG